MAFLRIDPASRAPSALALAFVLTLALPVRAQDAQDGVAADGAQSQDSPLAAVQVGEQSADADSMLAQRPNPPASTVERGSTPTDPADMSNAAAADATQVAIASDDPPAPDPAPSGVDAAIEPPAPASDDPAAAPVVATDAQDATAAEDDFEALYGTPESGEARPVAYDPWERYNRRMHRFNNAVDRRVARPLARAYVRVVPGPVRTGVGNFFNNLGQPVSAVNALLQGKPRQAAHSVGRFLLNSTLGIGGVFDPATAAKLENRSEDFGQTLGVWGWRRSRYVELPLFGPRTLRDVIGMAGDAPLSPLRQVDADRIRVPLQGMQLVDLRAQLLSTDALRENVEDDYALVRDAWSQRRDYQIMGDRKADEDPTVVPVDAMPVPINN